MTENQQLRMIKRTLDSYQWQTACLPDSLPPLSRVGSSCLGYMQQEGLSSMIYSWYQGRNGVEDAETRLGHIPLHKRRRDQQMSLSMRNVTKENTTPHCPGHTMR